MPHEEALLFSCPSSSVFLCLFVGWIRRYWTAALLVFPGITRSTLLLCTMYRIMGHLPTLDFCSHWYVSVYARIYISDGSTCSWLA
ncbi:hypothetical protein V8C43DRAFT_149287 [Trichoderma afarasin]